MKLAIVGVTGKVGQKFLDILQDKFLYIEKLYCFASDRSAGKRVLFKNVNYEILELNEDNIKKYKVDYALFSIGEILSKKFAPLFVDNGTIVIDNSSAWRMEENVPLIVPEVNIQEIKRHKGIISNPNCSTIQCMLILQIINKLFRIKSINYSTYQAVSGSGVKGINDLKNTSRGGSPEFYPYPIYNNCLPHIGNFKESGYTDEELKMIYETKKILNLPDINISATCVRVPVENCHSVNVDVECEENICVELFRYKLSKEKSLVLLDDINNNKYPIASIADDKDEIYVGRIRKDLFNNKLLHFFCVTDNIRKGAATNAVQILENIIR